MQTTVGKKIKFWLAIFLVLGGSYLSMEGIKYLGLKSLHQQHQAMQVTSS